MHSSYLHLSLTSLTESGFTHALVVDLASEAALEAYATHPEHVAVLTNDLRPNFEAPPLAMDYEF